MILAKNLGGRVGFKENFKGVKHFLKIYVQICEKSDIPKIFFKNAIFGGLTVVTLSASTCTNNVQILKPCESMNLCCKKNILSIFLSWRYLN